MAKDIQILIDQLKQKPTRQLLAEFELLRASQYENYYIELGYMTSWYAREAGYDHSTMMQCYKDELATREHIANKPEARERRRKAATAHHGPKKRKLKYQS